jgi:hypothetical protein
VQPAQATNMQRGRERPFAGLQIRGEAAARKG